MPNFHIWNAISFDRYPGMPLLLTSTLTVSFCSLNSSGAPSNLLRSITMHPAYLPSFGISVILLELIISRALSRSLALNMLLSQTSRSWNMPSFDRVSYSEDMNLSTISLSIVDSYVPLCSISSDVLFISSKIAGSLFMSSFTLTYTSPSIWSYLRFLSNSIPSFLIFMRPHSASAACNPRSSM